MLPQSRGWSGRDGGEVARLSGGDVVERPAGRIKGPVAGSTLGGCDRAGPAGGHAESVAVRAVVDNRGAGGVGEGKGDLGDIERPGNGDGLGGCGGCGRAAASDLD